MRRIFLTILLLGVYLEAFRALPSGNGSGSVLDEIKGTSITVNREGALDSQNEQDAQSHFHHPHNGNFPDNVPVQYQEYPNQIQNNHPHQTSYEDLHYDHEPQVHLLLNPGKGNQKNSLCPHFSQFSIIGVVLAMLLIFNGLISALSMYNMVDNGGTGTISNMFTNTDTNNNQDTNNNNNDETNVNININDLFPRLASQGRKSGSSIWEEESNDAEEEEDCSCPQGEEDSWLFKIKEYLLALWTVGQDFNSENPDCSSRLACEVASSLPSSLSPVLELLSSGMEEKGSLLMSAASGNCALAYDRCPISFIQVTQWL